MRKFGRRLLIALPCAAAVVLVGLACVYRASQQAPAFYQKALTRQPATLRDEGQQFERQALALHNQLAGSGEWEVRFTQDEINGWLATELPAKFARALPPGITDPRVAIVGDELHLAVHYRRGRVDTVLSLVGEVSLTSQPNEVAVRIDQARAGALPVPLGSLIHEISDRATRSNVHLRWTEVKGAPVALFRLPLGQEDDSKKRVALDQLRLTDGQLVIGGRTIEPPAEEAGSKMAAQADDSETRQR